MADEQRRALPRRYGVALAAVPVLAVGLADATIAVRTVHSSSPPAHHAAVAARPIPQPTASFTLNDAETKRDTALHDLLARRRAAVLHHDRAAFLATDDSTQKTFLASQRKEFDALKAVPLASWDYEIDLSIGLPPSARARRYHVPVFTPSSFSVHYRIAGFDDRATSLVQTPTFVQRHGEWFIASFDDFATSGNPSERDIWSFGPLRTARAPHVLVIGHPGSGDLMRQLATETSQAIPRVSAVWGRAWPRKVVVLVPATQRELGVLVDEKGDLSQIAAVASAEVQSCPGEPDPVGGRVAVNPRNWLKLSSRGRQIVLTHELTHVATRAVTSACMPTWLVEGFADYVAYLHAGVSTGIVASELAKEVRAGRVPRALPTSKDFLGTNKRLPQAYEEGWMAARLVASTAGQSALVRLYTAVGTSQEAPSIALAKGLRSVLHLTTAQFITRWQKYLRSQLS